MIYPLTRVASLCNLSLMEISKSHSIDIHDHTWSRVNESPSYSPDNSYGCCSRDIHSHDNPANL